MINGPRADNLRQPRSRAELRIDDSGEKERHESVGRY